MDSATIGDDMRVVTEFDWENAPTRTTDEIGDLAEAGFDCTIEDIVDVARADPECTVNFLGFEEA
jgi:hypothetical protein